MTHDLDDLIRRSIADHTPEAPADPTLADAVAITGRRVRRRRRTAALASVSLVVVGAVTAFGLRALPNQSTPAIATPAPMAPPSVSTSGTGITTDVTTIGTPIKDGELANYFTSPTGNLWCVISPKEATCWAIKYAAGVQPTDTCPEEATAGNIVTVGQGPATWGCQLDIGAIPFLDVPDNSGVLWWNSTIGLRKTVTGWDTGSVLAALRYGNTLTSGDMACSMATDGVTCTNNATGHGFHLNRSGAQLR